jgi:hypothetical protein
MVNSIDSEKFLYQIIKAIESSGFSLIYKGALVTNLILFENNFNLF